MYQIKHDELNNKKISENITHYVFAIDDIIIGFARALGDAVFNAAIYDVVVHANH